MRAVRMLKSVNGGYVRMVQRSQHLGFTLKASKSLGIVRERFGENLDRYITPQLCVMGLVNFSHAARTNRASDFIRAELGASGERHHFFPVGTFCFNSSVQFSTTVISACGSSPAFTKRNRCPSAVMS